MTERRDEVALDMNDAIDLKLKAEAVVKCAEMCGASLSIQTLRKHRVRLEHLLDLLGERIELVESRRGWERAR